MGEDSKGVDFSSIEEFWNSELENNNQKKRDQWYSKTIEYWSHQDPSVNGVLAGYESVSPVDLEASINFLQKIKKLPEAKEGPCNFGTALDCGAGIGRVTMVICCPTPGCLTQCFQKTDLLEPVHHLLEQAKSALSSNPLVGNFYKIELQNFTPEPNKYDCIWLQWCILYLTDNDLVALLQRCKQKLRPKGIICVKENVVLDGEGFHLDRDDNSLMRTDLHYRRLFSEAGLKVILEMRQPKFPKDYVFIADQGISICFCRKDVWLIEFFAPWCGHCKAFASEYEKVARALEGVVNVGAIEDQSAMAQEGVQGFPTVKLYLGKGNGVIEYSNARTSQNVVDFVMKEVTTLTRKRLNGKSSERSNIKKSRKGSGTSDVIELSDSDFDTTVVGDEKSVWFLEFYAPWCGHCKALVPIWEEVATNLKGKVKVAKIDATVNTALAARFNVRGYPTLILLPSGKKSVSSGVSYNGPRDADALVNFAMGFAGEALQAAQLLDNKQFQDECNKGVCIISFLPHLYDSGAEGRKSYLKKLNDAVKASISMPVKFLWVQGGDNLDIEDKLRLQFGYPAVVATRIDKSRYAIHKGDFSSESIRSFLTSLMSGRQALSALPEKLPEFTTVLEWDGNDTPKESSVDDEL